MQREIRGTPQARRRLHLLRFHAGPQLRHRGSKSDAWQSRNTSTNNTPLYLDRCSGATPSCRSSRQSSSSERQQQLQEQLQQAAFTSETEKVPLPPVSPNRQAAAAAEQKARARARACAAKQVFSCEWPRLSEGINNLKKALFGASPGKTAKRG